MVRKAPARDEQMETNLLQRLRGFLLCAGFYCAGTRKSLVAAELGVNAFHGESGLPLGLLDAVTVRLLALVVICVVL